ncbi:MAG: HlyD family efflux transporter periplasmic adaptor subunit [Chloroflexi bacterium]|nr:HlyD family efflux transporter periplasmic adaptor subunit [Chloroflexota bacterium]
MRRLFLITTLILIAFGLLACGGAPTPTPKPTAAISVVKASSKVVAEGKIVPVKSAAIGFQVGGIIAQAPAQVGDKVQAGQVLAQLDAKQFQLQLDQAEGNLASAKAKLDQLKRGPIASDLSAAQQSVKSAEAAYNNLLTPDPNEMIGIKADIEKAKAAVDRAQAAYDRIGGDSNPFANMTLERMQLQQAWLDYQKALSAYNLKITPPKSQVEAAISAIQNARNGLSKLTPQAEDIAAAEAAVKTATAARDLAAENLKNTKLAAPFDGVITAIDLRVGEFAAPNAVVARIADTAQWQVETTDLTEINIVSVKEGDPVTVTLDAISGLELIGKVTRIKGFGENRQGDIVYSVTVALDKQDERLRWNMTAKVSIGK